MERGIQFCRYSSRGRAHPRTGKLGTQLDAACEGDGARAVARHSMELITGDLYDTLITIYWFQLISGVWMQLLTPDVIVAEFSGY